jgi:hypothetical protein
MSELDDPVSVRLPELMNRKMAGMLDKVFHVLASISNHITDVHMGNADSGPPVWGLVDDEEGIDELITVMKIRGYADTLKYFREMSRERGIACTNNT